MSQRRAFVSLSLLDMVFMGCTVLSGCDGVKLRYIRAGCGWFGATTIGQHSKNACASAVWFNPLQQ